MNTNTKHILFLLFFVILPFFAGAQTTHSADFHNRYTLSEVVVLSRHNIRSPLSGKGSAIERITPHNWYSWTSEPSYLSTKGGIMETMMGQYFHRWLVKERLFMEDSTPKPDEIRVYANSMQRTLATAHYFLSGFMPFADIPVKQEYAIQVMDPVFTPQITHLDDEFCKKAFREIAEIAGEEAETHKVSDNTYYCVLRNIPQRLKNNYKYLHIALDMQNSPACKYGDTCGFAGPDTIWLRMLHEPTATGSLKLANTATDALILQYYEERNDRKAAFGHKLNINDWTQISSIKDWYGDVLFTAPTIARQVAEPLLCEIAKELSFPNRKFSFLCGHDSNIASVLAVLGVTNYSLPNTIESKTPIGAKLVFEKWMDTQGEYYISVNLMYHSTNQIRLGQYEPNGNEPIIFPIHFDGLQTNVDGLYSFNDIIEILNYHK